MCWCSVHLGQPCQGSVMAADPVWVFSQLLVVRILDLGHFAGLNIPGKERRALIFWVWRGRAVCEGRVQHLGMKTQHPRHSLSHGAKS